MLTEMPFILRGTHSPINFWPFFVPMHHTLSSTHKTIFVTANFLLVTCSRHATHLFWLLNWCSMKEVNSQRSQRLRVLKSSFRTKISPKGNTYNINVFEKRVETNWSSWLIIFVVTLHYSFASKWKWYPRIGCVQGFY